MSEWQMASIALRQAASQELSRLLCCGIALRGRGGVDSGVLIRLALSYRSRGLSLQYSFYPCDELFTTPFCLHLCSRFNIEEMITTSSFDVSSSQS